MGGMRKSLTASVTVAVAALILLLAGGGLLIGIYIDSERQRDLRQWESRLSLVAEGKADSIARLVQAERRNLLDLAENASLQLYLWQVVQAREAGTEAAQLGFLRNLMLAAAERGGYLPPLEAAIPANVPRAAASGLALLDSRLVPVISTPGLGDPRPQYAGFLERARELPARAHLSEMLLDAEDRPVLVTALAVGAPPGVSREAQPAAQGLLLAVRSASQELIPLLIRGPAFAEPNEALLLVQRDDAVFFISPASDALSGLRRSLPLDDSRFAEAAAVMQPGRLVELENYRDRRVLQVAREVRGQDWLVAQQVDAAEAMSIANERRNLLLLALSLLLLFIAACVVAAWRHGSSVRARAQAAELERHSGELQRRTDLLHAISDNINVLTLLATREGRLRFVNQAAARAIRIRRDDLVGRVMEDVLPGAHDAGLAASCAQAREQRKPVQRLVTLPLGDGPREFQASFIPVATMCEERDLTLAVLGDITELRAMEDRHSALLRDLVRILATVVDRHDPYAAEHTRRIRQLAGLMADELALSPPERETLDLAATLANIGKIMIPDDLLTKPGPLTEAEQALLRKHVDYTIELLRGIDFDGPVLEVIAQKQERLDGSGYPRGTAGETISLPGRILAVANAFVALVSARAWRDGLPVRDALDQLLAGAGTQYDRRVIAALFHVAENRLDLGDWEPPPDQE